jgi:hypothetical protein
MNAILANVPIEERVAVSTTNGHTAILMNVLERLMTMGVPAAAVESVVNEAYCVEAQVIAARLQTMVRPAEPTGRPMIPAGRKRSGAEALNLQDRPH